MEARKKEKIDISAVLEKSALQEKHMESGSEVLFPLLLVGMAVLLLVVQLWG